MSVAAVALVLAGSAWGQDNAVTFDGQWDYVRLGRLDPGTDFTVEAWVIMESSPDYQTVFEAVDSSDALNSFYVGYVSDHWQVEIDDTTVYEGDTCTSTASESLCHPSADGLDGTARHVAVTVSPDEIVLYLDGVPVDTEDVAASPTFGSATWVLGADTDERASFVSDSLNGFLDEVRIWEVVRTAEEIECTRDYALTGSEPDLYAYWPMDDAAGTSFATDASGGGWTGILRRDAAFDESPFGLVPTEVGDLPCLDYDGDGYDGDDGDCDETDPAVHPGASETCDGLDEDCDGTVDEEAVGAPTWHPDADGDGWGDVLSARSACTAPEGYVADGTDCDDGDASVHPGASETWYDGIDQDCDGNDDDQDGDGWPVDTDCDDLDPDVYPGAPGWTEDCEEIGDTGDTGGPGPGDTGDPDTGDTGGPGPDDTGGPDTAGPDTGTPDSGAPPPGADAYMGGGGCTCGAPARGLGGGILGLLVAAALALRGRETGRGCVTPRPGAR